MSSLRSQFMCLPRFTGRVPGCLCSRVPQMICLFPNCFQAWLVASSSFDVSLHLFPKLAGGVHLTSMSPNPCYPALRMSIFTSLPSFVSWFCFWCPALWMSVLTCFPSWVSEAGSWRPALHVAYKFPHELALAKFNIRFDAASSQKNVCVRVLGPIWDQNLGGVAFLA